MKSIVCAIALVAVSFAASAADAPPAPKGTVCFVNTLRTPFPEAISCRDLGKFATVAEIYERGYRVVTAGILAETGGAMFLIIEERK
jgi:hypothetical protein